MEILLLILRYSYRENPENLAHQSYILNDLHHNVNSINSFQGLTESADKHHGN